MSRVGIMLRFRDLVTEPRGNIAEHRRLMNELGFAWWGWWARSQEATPSVALHDLLNGENEEVSLLLFDSGVMEIYHTLCAKMVVSPGALGIGSPDFRATPHYYVRGRYPAWFRLHGDIVPFGADSVRILDRPTLRTSVEQQEWIEERKTIEELRNEQPTLWMVELSDEE